MRDWELPWDGGCRCGKVRFRVSAPPLVTMACHCRGCQRMTASAFSLSVAVPTDGFALTEGEVDLGGLHGPQRHHFCGWCKSWLFTRMEGIDWFVNVRATALDDPAWYAPFVETCTSERLSWAATPAMHNFPGLPEEAAWPEILGGFERWADARVGRY
jgi:hypothetical protein